EVGAGAPGASESPERSSPHPKTRGSRIRVGQRISTSARSVVRIEPWASIARTMEGAGGEAAKEAGGPPRSGSAASMSVRIPRVRIATVPALVVAADVPERLEQGH